MQPFAKKVQQEPDWFSLDYSRFLISLTIFGSCDWNKVFLIMWGKTGAVPLLRTLGQTSAACHKGWLAYTQKTWRYPRGAVQFNKSGRWSFRMKRALYWQCAGAAIDSVGLLWCNVHCQNLFWMEGNPINKTSKCTFCIETNRSNWNS